MPSLFSRFRSCPLLLAAAWLAACAPLPHGERAPAQAASSAAVQAPDPAMAAVFGGCDGVQPQPDSLGGARSYTYRHASGRDLRLHVFQPERPAPAADGVHSPVLTPAPAVLFFFGGGWRTGRIESFEPQARAFAAAGYVAVLADYRVKCRDGTTALGSLADARAAYAWLRAQHAELGIDLHRIVLSGGSAGGHLALATAQKADADAQPAALVLFNPAVDLVGPAPWYLKLPAWTISPSVLSLRDLPATLILHGEADRVVPIASVRDFCRRAQSAGRECTVQAYPEQGHSFFHRDTPDPRLSGHSPYAQTMSRAWTFLAAHGLPAQSPLVDAAAATDATDAAVAGAGLAQ